MRWSSMIFLAPAAALAAVWGCSSGGEATAATGASGSGGGSATASGTGGASTTASGTSGGSATTSTGQGGGGGSSATTTSGSSSAGSTGTGTSACTWAAVDPCGPGMYCDAPGCQQGTCVPSGGVETGDKTPVCGCDDVTYWNASVAKKQGQSVVKSGACAPGKTCGGFANLKCPGAATCAHQLSGSGECNAPDSAGNCWATPVSCPPVVLGSTTRACGAGKCADECSLIKGSASYYPDSTCPQ